MKKSFVAIGHIVKDTEPYDHIGGGVSYTAIAAKKLGFDAQIITKCDPDSEYVKYLQDLGIKVHLLPTKQKTITTFRNTYDEKGHRTQQVPAQQEKIVLKDFVHFPKEILRDAMLLAAPVVAEVDTKLFPVLAEYGYLAVVPQGYFRKIDRQGNVRQQKWTGFEKDLKSVQAIIFSEEDITIGGSFDHELLRKFRDYVPVTVLTQAERGSTVYVKDKLIHVSAFSLRKDEIKDFTGAGDTYAAFFLAELSLHNDIKKAALKASLLASLKILGMGGIGTDSIPNEEQIKTFSTINKKRLTQFYTNNG